MYYLADVDKIDVIVCKIHRLLNNNIIANVVGCTPIIMVAIMPPTNAI